MKYPVKPTSLSPIKLTPLSSTSSTPQQAPIPSIFLKSLQFLQSSTLSPICIHGAATFDPQPPANNRSFLPPTDAPAPRASSESATTVPIEAASTSEGRTIVAAASPSLSRSASGPAISIENLLGFNPLDFPTPEEGPSEPTDFKAYFTLMELLTVPPIRILNHLDEMQTLLGKVESTLPTPILEAFHRILDMKDMQADIKAAMDKISDHKSRQRLNLLIQPQLAATKAKKSALDDLEKEAKSRSDAIDSMKAERRALEDQLAQLDSKIQAAEMELSAWPAKIENQKHELAKSLSVLKGQSRLAEAPPVDLKVELAVMQPLRDAIKIALDRLSAYLVGR